MRLQPKEQFKLAQASSNAGRPTLLHVTSDQRAVMTTPPAGTDSPPSGQTFFSWIFPGIFVVLGAVILFYGLRNVERAHSSKAWPKTEGVITFATMGRHRSNSSSTYSGDVSYDYKVGGTTYSSSRISFGQFGSSDSSHARSVLNRYPVDRKVEVFYSPADPALSVLETGVSISDWFCLRSVGYSFSEACSCSARRDRLSARTEAPDLVLATRAVVGRACLHARVMNRNIWFSAVIVSFLLGCVVYASPTPTPTPAPRARSTSAPRLSPTPPLKFFRRNINSPTPTPTPNALTKTPRRPTPTPAKIPKEGVSATGGRPGPIDLNATTSGSKD